MICDKPFEFASNGRFVLLAAFGVVFPEIRNEHKRVKNVEWSIFLHSGAELLYLAERNVDVHLKQQDPPCKVNGHDNRRLLFGHGIDAELLTNTPDHLRNGRGIEADSGQHP